MICFRLLDSDDPATPLAEAVATLRRGEDAESAYTVNPKSFRQVPNAPFAYWVSERIRGLFTELQPFESDGRTAKQGLATADDFRFVRTAWETPEVGTHQAWFPFAKGGSYSPFYADVHLHVNWKTDGLELDAFSGSVLRNTDYYFRPGIVFPRRTKRFCPKILPRQIIFSNAGQVVFAPGIELATSALLFSSTLQNLIFCSLGTTPQDLGGSNPQFEVGVIQNAPFKISDRAINHLSPLAKSAWSLKRQLDTTNSNSHAFYAPALRPTATSTPTTATDA